jgi:hypothetical protein
VRRSILVLLFASITLFLASTARATLSVYTYFGPEGTSIWGAIHEGPGTFGPRYYNRVYRPADGLPHQMCLRYHYSDGSYTPWQCDSASNPFYARNMSGAYLTAYPAKAQCKYYYSGGGPNEGLNKVTCQTTVGLP